MGAKRISYYDFAENDYLYLKNSYERGDFSNAMAVLAQSICEGYFKHVVDTYCQNVPHEELTDALHSHSLRRLKTFFTKYLSDFECDWGVIMNANGFYFSARYPGDDSFFVEKEDVKECWEAVEETKRAVDCFLANTPVEKNDITQEVILTDLKGFGN